MKRLPISEYARMGDLLELAALSYSDLYRPGRHFFRFKLGRDLVGYGGLEGYAPDMLLRSVLVMHGSRRQGVGRTMVELIEGQAATWGCKRLHLLTESAAAFFLNLSYGPAARSDAPSVIAQSNQMKDLCPTTAHYLVKDLAR